MIFELMKLAMVAGVVGIMLYGAVIPLQPPKKRK